MICPQCSSRRGDLVEMNHEGDIKVDQTRSSEYDEDRFQETDICIWRCPSCHHKIPCNNDAQH